ncbi:MAG TPA: LysR family transcriptional regulator, partial [Atopostipes sp.]|nr:LysR family transcriptional regulator [Atopostipes sp.]
MEFRTLQYFLAVAQEENLSKAAEVLHITQPTLSRQMQRLEEELNAQLFIRGKNFSLTNAGLLLKERAEEMISLSEKTKSEFEQVNQMIGGTISIGSAAIGNKSILTDLMAEFRSQFPKVSFELITGTGPEITEGINKGLLDVGLLIEPLPYEKYAYKKLSHVEKWGVIMHKDSPLADKEQISAEDLKEMTVAYSFRKDTQKLLSNHLKIDVTELDTFG